MWLNYYYIFIIIGTLFHWNCHVSEHLRISRISSVVTNNCPLAVNLIHLTLTWRIYPKNFSNLGLQECQAPRVVLLKIKLYSEFKVQTSFKVVTGQSAKLAHSSLAKWILRWGAGAGIGLVYVLFCCSGSGFFVCLRFREFCCFFVLLKQIYRLLYHGVLSKLRIVKTVKLNLF